MTTREIELPSGHIALIDEEDWKLVEPFAWFATHASSRITYASSQLPRNGKKLQMHRLIIDAPIGIMVDHRNHNGLDNRRKNLRLCTNAQNQANARLRTDNTTGYKGVRRVAHSSAWRAFIYVNGVDKYLGTYDDPESAAAAYNAAAHAAWGEFAFLNPGTLCESVRRTATRRRGGSTAPESGYRGVSWYSARSRWRAVIYLNSQQRWLGCYDDPWEAAQAYNVAARAAWGDAAYINVRHPDPAEQVAA